MVGRLIKVRHLHRLSDAAQGHLAMLLFSALVAGSFSLGALVANDIAPSALNAVRFLIAAIVIGVIGYATRQFDRRLLNAPWRFAVLGGLFSIYFVLMFEALKTAAPVSTAAMFTLTPLISALFGWILLRQKTTPKMMGALIVGAMGAIWVIFRADLPAILSFRIGAGEQVFFWGVVAHSIYTPMARRLNRGESPIAMTFGMLLAGTVILFAYGWSDLETTDWGQLRPIVWITIAYTSLIAGATTFTLVQFATLKLPASKVMAYTYLTPTWVLMWELSLGHGVPPALVLAGVLLTILALLLLLKDR